jgi:DNA-binding HxlR family transcriptional regulator
VDEEASMADPMKRLPMLPVERALKVISGRWKAVILYQLFSGPKRLSELQALVPAVTQKVLIQQLREMQEHGLVGREIFRQVPPRVDYLATPLGLSLAPVIATLCDWGRRHAADLEALEGGCDGILRLLYCVGSYFSPILRIKLEKVEI